MWIARDKDGKLFLYIEKPIRTSINWKVSSGPCISIDSNLFSYLKWENEPMEVGLYMIDKQIPVSKMLYSKAIRSQLKMK